MQAERGSRGSGPSAAGPQRGEGGKLGLGGAGWADLFGWAGLVWVLGCYGFGFFGFPFLILTLFPISISNSNSSQMNSNLNLNSL